ncbi:MAG: hypothetical protein E7Z64_01975 [Thermoplasmata archaeon]|nr:hypothetical protein [Thermoplasmata archaeon]
MIDKQRLVVFLIFGGALLMILGSTTTWIIEASYGTSGWDIFYNFDDPDGFSEKCLKYAPLVTLIIGVLILIMPVVTIFFNNMIVRFVNLVSVPLSVVSLFMLIKARGEIVDILEGVPDSSVGAGLYMAIVGCILVIIGAIVVFLVVRNAVLGATEVQCAVAAAKAEQAEAAPAEEPAAPAEEQ